MMTTDYADSFEQPEHGIYLLAHSIGLMPTSTASVLQEKYFARWQSAQTDIWDHWLHGVQDFRDALASLFNSHESQFCPQSNVSSGLSKVVSCLPATPQRNVILACESDFPSAGFVLQQAQQFGFELRFIPKQMNAADPAVWEEMLTADVVAAFITHVHYRTNTLVPVEQISDICRRKEVFSIVDIAQSAGIVPIDLKQWRVNVVVGSCIKWLCGGPGAGFLWLDQELSTTLEPNDVGWFSHRNPFEFDIHNFDYADNANRFWGGTPSVVPFISAANSIELMHRIGIQTIQQHNQDLSAKILQKVPSSAIVSPTQLDKKGGTLVFKFKNQADIENALTRQQIRFDSRKDGLRISPHIYTKEAEIDQLIEAMCYSTKRSFG